MKIVQTIPVKILYVHTSERKDEYLRSRLEKHLAPLPQLTHWSPRLVLPGEDALRGIDHHLKTSDLILLLISADFLADERCRHVAERAMERFLAGEVCLIPILLRPANYENTPFAQLSLLPSNGRPITSWPDPEKALHDVAKGLYNIIEEVRTRLAPLSSFKPLWSVPYERNMLFTGREALLTHLSHVLRPGQTPTRHPPQAISGLGGIGKTQIALEYVYRYQDEYQAIFWIRADSQEMLQADLLAISQVLDIPQADAWSLMIHAVQRWLRDYSNWLLVFDNVEDIAVIQPFLLYQRTGSILLTTRAKAIGNSAQRIDLEYMTIEEGTTFLLRRTNQLHLDTSAESIDPTKHYWVESIIGMMEGLPLALDQAGAFIEETQCSFEVYYQLFQQRQFDLLQRRGDYKGTHPDPVATTWSLSFSKIQQFNSIAIEFLSLCAFLDPARIPEDLFTIGDGEKNLTFTPIVQDPLVFQETIGILLSYSLIHRNPDRTLTLHRLLQTVLKQHMGPQKQRYWAKRAVQVVNYVFPEAVYEKWERCRRYLPQALMCVSHIEQYQLTSLEATKLLHKVGFYFYSYAQYKEVEPYYLRAQRIAEEVVGSEHAFTATILNTLANLYYVNNDHGKAEQFFQRALTIREKALGLEHLDTAESLNDLARLYYSHAQYTEAEIRYRCALAIREKNLGSHDTTTADSLQHLGVLYHAQKRYAEAEQFYQRALAVQEEILSPEHPKALNTLDCLARLHYDQGNYTDLEPLYQRILATRKNVLGPDHPHTAISMDSLAWLYRDQKRYEEAETLHQQAWEIRKKMLEPQHPNIAVSLDALATVYQAQGKYTRAEHFYKEALSIREQAKGLEHPYTLQSFLALVSFYSGQGHYDHAELLYHQGLMIRQEKLGTEHSHTIVFLQRYADFLRKLQRFEEAHQLEAQFQTHDVVPNLFVRQNSMMHHQACMIPIIKPPPLLF